MEPIFIFSALGLKVKPIIKNIISKLDEGQKSKIIPLFPFVKVHNKFVGIPPESIDINEAAFLDLIQAQIQNTDPNTQLIFAGLAPASLFAHFKTEFPTATYYFLRTPTHEESIPNLETILEQKLNSTAKLDWFESFSRYQRAAIESAVLENNLTSTIVNLSVDTESPAIFTETLSEGLDPILMSISRST